MNIGDARQWFEYLEVAANNYKYSQANIGRIQDQQPTAKNCATLPTWNKLGRRIKKGTKGIMISSADDKMIYVFPLSSTYPVSDSSLSAASARPQNELVWSRRAEHDAAIISALDGEEGGAEETIIKSIEKQNEIDIAELSELSNTDAVQLANLINLSTSYAVLYRAGYDTNSINKDAISAACEYYDSLSDEVKTELSEAIITYTTQRISNNLRTIETAVKNYNKTNERSNKNEHTESKDNLHREGGRTTLSNVSRGRQGADSVSEGGGRTETIHREIRRTETAISSGEQPSGILAFEGSEQTLENARGAERSGDEEGRRDSGSDGAVRGNGRKDDGDRPNEMGGAYDQLQILRDGDNTQRDDLHLDDISTPLDMELSQAEIDTILCRGSGICDGKLRIYEQFLKNESKEENAAFLKKEYGWGGSYPAATINGICYEEEHDGKGISIKRNEVGNTAVTAKLNWAKVATRIDELIKAGRYLNDKELTTGYSEYLRNNEARNAREELIKEFVPTVDAYIAYKKESGADDLFEPNHYYALSAASSFIVGEKRFFTRNMTGDWSIDYLTDTLNTLVRSNATEDITNKANALLAMLNSSELASELRPTAEELERFNESIAEPTYHYEFKSGDTVTIDNTIYEVIDSDNSVVRLFEQNYPLFTREEKIDDFIIMLSESIDNRRLLVRDEVTEEKTNAQPTAAVEAIEDDEEVAPAAKSAEEAIEGAAADYDEHINEQVTIDDRVYRIDSYNAFTHNYSLTDITFSDNTGVPITRNEKRGNIIRLISENKNKELSSPPSFLQPTAPKKEKAAILLPEVATSGRRNYTIDNAALGEGTPSERYSNNIAAIKTLHKLKEENRLATKEEQDILSKYVGWGGLSDYFDEKSNKYNELLSSLSSDEYNSAKSSVLTSFYTPPVVTSAINNALVTMGLKRGNILEPSCGTGNFIGAMPESLKDCNVYGVEIDTMSGQIAQQLYQRSNIAITGFENASLPDSYFDAAVGNVPFGQFKVNDCKYNRYNFLIHDYFFAKTLDKVRPGGIIAFVTSKGTLDKNNSAARKYISERADLAGAIRLPDNTFKSAAGTEVTSDIIFLQKRSTRSCEYPSWTEAPGVDSNGITINKYFIDNPENILGDMVNQSSRFGVDSACKAKPGVNLETQLAAAIARISANISIPELSEGVSIDESAGDNSSTSAVVVIPADPQVKNFSYTIIDGEIYFRENSIMTSVTGRFSNKETERLKGLIGIRDCLRSLIEYQTEDYPDGEIKAQQDKLNLLYEAYVSKHGRIRDSKSQRLISEDISRSLLTSLEVQDDNGNFVRTADIMNKRTIKPHYVAESAENANDALIISIQEKGRVDMEFMTSLTGLSEERLYSDLSAAIFLNPEYVENGRFEKYITADEYLSGNIRNKLAFAEQASKDNAAFITNVNALKEAMPPELTASEISVRLGATWIPSTDIEQFVFELLNTPKYATYNIKINYSSITGEWYIAGKSFDRYSVNGTKIYGTERKNAYTIIEDTLNLREVKVMDAVEDPDGRKRYVLNRKETMLARAKQNDIREAFKNWIWEDPERRERLCRRYNELFNSTRTRDFSPDFISALPGMNTEIILREHQKKGIAHVLYGENTLLAHGVGAGKTFAMIASAMESKRLGMCNKPMFVVPNHIINQWGADFLQLYPSANILVATPRDFQKEHRREFCSRIATGDYDAIIIGHTQFEKLPMSIERRQKFIQDQIDDITEAITEEKRRRDGSNITVKRLELVRRNLSTQLEKLLSTERKDDVITFEELGVDKLYIDEAHNYKNLYVHTQMQNVSGISQSGAQKSADLFMKCRYLDSLTGGRGVVFATGTPVSNSMAELYTMQRYLQYNRLEEKGLQHFDSWASTFGETTTAIELSVDGSGFRTKTRFAKFYNLPELMTMFKEVADIVTQDEVRDKLDLPKVERVPVAVEPTEYQKEYVKSLGDRAELIHSGTVDPRNDNMLKITSEGRKVALDQRIIDEMIPKEDGSKVGVCIDNIYNIWKETEDERLTQSVFCDLSTPAADRFNVYDEIRNELESRGVPKEEIAFIHEVEDKQKEELFKKVRSGKVRIILGSTPKMGAGTNIQDRMIALHHLDCPWRPSDLQQREGRIERQGNVNKNIKIFNYVTKGTFDSYMYQTVEQKQRFISQVFTSKSPSRTADDIDEMSLTWAEIKACATGDPKIKERVELENSISQLQTLKSAHKSQIYRLQDQVLKVLPVSIAAKKGRIEGLKNDIERVKVNTIENKDGFSPMVVNDIVYSEKKAAGAALISAVSEMKSPSLRSVGNYRGFEMLLAYDIAEKSYTMTLKGDISFKTTLGNDAVGNITRLDNKLNNIQSDLLLASQQLDILYSELETAKSEMSKPFSQEDELSEKVKRLNELNAELSIDNYSGEFADDLGGSDEQAQGEQATTARSSMDDIENKYAKSSVGVSDEHTSDAHEREEERS